MLLSGNLIDHCPKQRGGAMLPKRNCQGPAYTRSWDLEIMDFFQWVFLSAVLSNQLVITVPLEQKNLRLWKMYLSMQLPHLADRDLTARLTFRKSPWWACSSSVSTLSLPWNVRLLKNLSDFDMIWKIFIFTSFKKKSSLKFPLLWPENTNSDKTQERKGENADRKRVKSLKGQQILAPNKASGWTAALYLQTMPHSQSESSRMEIGSKWMLLVLWCN